MPKKILIIDDEPDIAKTIWYRLKSKGYEVISAANGNEGVEMVKIHRPDLVILDYLLCDLKAAEFKQYLEGDAKFIVPPIILATASIEGVKEKAEECGASDYVTKPIEPEELYRKVEQQIGLA